MKILAIIATIVFSFSSLFSQQVPISLSAYKTLMIDIPDHFEPAYQVSNEDTYLVEFVPIGENVEYWSEMITLEVLTTPVSMEYYLDNNYYRLNQTGDLLSWQSEITYFEQFPAFYISFMSQGRLSPSQILLPSTCELYRQLGIQIDDGYLTITHSIRADRYELNDREDYFLSKHDDFFNRVVIYVD